MPPCDWIDIHWPDIAAGDAARRIAVLPLAATEQHGPHLPLGTDTFIAESYLARVRDLLPTESPATFLPVQSIGLSTEHLAYPGTLTLPPEVAIRQWMAIGESVARAGIRKLVIVTSHGGNAAAMALVAQELRAQRDMLVVTTSWGRLSAAERLFPAAEVQHGIHGGAIETSIMLARHPQHVRTDRIADFTPLSLAMAREFKVLSAQRPAPFAWQAQDLHPSGAIGDARLATADAGEALLDHGARAFCDLLADMDRFDPARLGREPTP